MLQYGKGEGTPEMQAELDATTREWIDAAERAGNDVAWLRKNVVAPTTAANALRGFRIVAVSIAALRFSRAIGSCAADLQIGCHALILTLAALVVGQLGRRRGLGLTRGIRDR